MPAVRFNLDDESHARLKSLAALTRQPIGAYAASLILEALYGPSSSGRQVGRKTTTRHDRR